MAWTKEIGKRKEVCRVRFGKRLLRWHICNETGDLWVPTVSAQPPHGRGPVRGGPGKRGKDGARSPPGRLFAQELSFSRIPIQLLPLAEDQAFKEHRAAK